MKVICVATHKGGAGKTVTAMSLAAGFARTGVRTLLVDLDPQGHSTIGLGLELADGQPTIADMVQGAPCAPLAYRFAGGDAAVDVLPSNIRLERVQYWLYAQPRREQFLLRLVRPLADAYDLCIIDTPPSLGVLAEGAVAAADLVLIPCQMEARATDGLVDLLELMALLKGEAFDRWWILRTRVDCRKGATNAAVHAQLEPWAAHLLPTSIPQCEPLNHAQMRQKDIFTYAPASTGAQAYARLVEELRVLLPIGETVARA
ncbi:MAG TPA: ParA family protein [Gemmatimonadales bacterium]|nr:ParA family protein [Gemmatimonadales bacterium]